MAIPVSNPPPRYEPTGQRPQGEPRGSPAGGPPELPPGPVFGPPTGQQRGCFIALGVLGALGCVASIAIVVSCASCFREAAAFSVDDITGEYRIVAEREGELEREGHVVDRGLDRRRPVVEDVDVHGRRDQIGRAHV